MFCEIRTSIPTQGAGLHAEQNLVRYAADNALNILGLEASRPICGVCWPEVSALGPRVTRVIGTIDRGHTFKYLTGCGCL